MIIRTIKVSTVIKTNLPAIIVFTIAIFDFAIMMVIGYKVGEVGSESMNPISIANFSRILALHFIVLMYAAKVLIKRIN